MLPTMQNENNGKTVKGSLYFLDRSDGKPVIQMSEIHYEPNVRSGEFRDITVTLRDARCLAQQPSLDREGFALGRFETRATDFYNEDQIADVYYPEIEQFLKSVTDATSVHIFDHTIRVEDEATRTEKGGPPARGDHPQRLHGVVRAGAGPGRDAENRRRALPQPSLHYGQRLALHRRLGGAHAACHGRCPDHPTG